MLIDHDPDHSPHRVSRHAPFVALRSLTFLAVMLTGPHALAQLSTPQCQASEACSVEGRCTAQDGACVAMFDVHCLISAGCKAGRCSARGGHCVVATAADCEGSDACRLEGRCTPRNGQCVAVPRADAGGARGWGGVPPGLPPDCVEACRKAGLCDWDGEDCVAWSPAACAASEECREDGQCILNREAQKCDDGRERNSASLMTVGIIFSGLGGFGIIFGVAQHVPFANSDCAAGSCATDAFIVAGGFLAVAGIPMAIAGGVKVSRDQASSSAIPELSVGVGQAELSWRF